MQAWVGGGGVTRKRNSEVMINQRTCYEKLACVERGLRTRIQVDEFANQQSKPSFHKRAGVIGFEVRKSPL